MLGIEPLSEHGAALIGAMSRRKASRSPISSARYSHPTLQAVRSSLCGLLSMVDGWRLFSKNATYDRLLEPGSINVVDLSGYGHDPQIKSCIVASLARVVI